MTATILDTHGRNMDKTDWKVTKLDRAKFEEFDLVFRFDYT